MPLGFGMNAIVLTQSAVYGVEANKADIASTLFNSSQQVGAAGTRSTEPQALVDGYGTPPAVGTDVLAAATSLRLPGSAAG